MKIICSLFLILCLTTEISCGKTIQKGIKGSGSVQKEERNSGSFTSIRVSRQITVFLTQGKRNSITVEADHNLLPYIKTTISGGQLQISLPQDIQVKDYSAMNVFVTAPQISELICTTSGKIKGTTSWKTQQLKIKTTTSGGVNLDLEADNIRLNATTSANIQLTGKASNLEANLTTSASLKAKNLRVGNAQLTMTTNSYAELSVARQLSYRLTTGSKLEYWGQPTLLKISTSTSGSAIHKD